jgi:hypothetical protein
LGSLKNKGHKTNPHTLEELRNNIRHDTSTISTQEHQKVTSSVVVLSAFCQEGNIFSICCSTDEFLLDFLKVMITENLFLASFTDC